MSVKTRSKLPNRYLTDELVDELVEAHEAGRWEYEVEVQARLGWTTTRFNREVTYLDHRYAMFIRLPSCRALKMRAAGLERYRSFEPLEADCECCA